MPRLIVIDKVRLSRDKVSRFQKDFERLKDRYSNPFLSGFLCLAIVASLYGCGAPPALTKSEPRAPLPVEAQIIQETSKALIVGTRWQFQESTERDGTPVFSASLPASDANFQDVLQVLLAISCSGTTVLVQVETTTDFRVSAAGIPIHYSLDHSAPQPLTVMVNATGHQLRLGAAAFARHIFDAQILSIDTSVGEPIYFNLAGLTDIRAKLAQGCPKAGF